MKLSFLVPTLGNREIELKRLLDSLVIQTYKLFEIVIIVQDNFEKMDAICAQYLSKLEIVLIKMNEKGLSKARNAGLPFCKGEVVILSDDDCWYPEEAAEMIVQKHQTANISILLTQIYDYNHDQDYKNYGNREKYIHSSFALLSKSSIEISFKRNKLQNKFDEIFGLGAKFVCCEEVDFLINAFRLDNPIYYCPIITVYHDKKHSKSNSKQIEAKGAIYAKYFNILIGVLVCVKDMVIRREWNFGSFLKGYNEYKKCQRKN